jgi:hypothetical protein
MVKFIFGAMKLLKKVKEAVGTRMLHQEVEPVRLRKGFNFNSAESVGILYKDVDEAFVNKLKEYASYLKQQF